MSGQHLNTLVNKITKLPPITLLWNQKIWKFLHYWQKTPTQTQNILKAVPDQFLSYGKL